MANKLTIKLAISCTILGFWTSDGRTWEDTKRKRNDQWRDWYEVWEICPKL